MNPDELQTENGKLKLAEKICRIVSSGDDAEVRRSKDGSVRIVRVKRKTEK